MFAALAPGAIGVHPKDIDDALRLAQLGGFAGLEVDAGAVLQAETEHGDGYLKARFAAAGIRPAGFGLPVDFRRDEQTYQNDLAALPAKARAVAALGIDRCMTWILPFSDDLAFEENFTRHRDRLRPAAEILANNGIRLGLEYVGPATMRAGKAHDFIYDQTGMLRLAEAVGPNTGLLVDCFHWFTSGGTPEDLRLLRPEQVVYVHVNDAAEGRTAAEQIDNDRRLPGESGVIPLQAFLDALRFTAYDGPVVCEPFRSTLKELATDEERVLAVAKSMQAVGLISP
jgi:sugar phosphate isomerase/epimerase